MPLRKYRGKGRRRYIRRKPRQYRKKQVSTLTRVPALINADRTIVRLRYVESVSVDPAISSFSGHLWRANGIYDPNYTGTGEGVCGAAEYYGFYTYSCVLGSRITANFFSGTNVVSTGSAICGVRLQNNNTIEGDLEDAIVNKNTRFKYLTNQTANGRVMVSKNFSLKKWAGNDQAASNTTYHEAVGSGVSTPFFYNTFVGSILSGYDVSGVVVNVVIDYIVLFFSPKSMTV